MYKILLNRFENYYGDVTTEYKTTSNFNDVLAAKGMSKLPSLKRVYRILQKDRMCYVFPASVTVAKLFGLNAMPSIEEENQPSSWDATIGYIKLMYGDKYALGFERADYPQLRKAA